MLEIRTTAKFESDLRRMLRVGKDAGLFQSVVELLASGEKIPAEFRDHELQGAWAGVRDIHIEADWLVLYQTTQKELILLRTGSHDDLFSKS